jgi:4-aminobutyrate aminotransferase
MIQEAPAIKVPHPGPLTRAVLERVRRNEVGAGLSFGLGDDPPVLARASGAVIEDPDGNRFLDMVAGFGSLNLGHSHPRVVAACTQQLSLGQQAMSIASVIRTDLLDRLSTLVGPGYQAILGASGSEAVETALKLIRRATGRAGVVAFSGGFHGRTLGALALMGRRSQRTGLGFLGGEVYHLPYPDPYRSPLGTTGGEVASATIRLLRAYLDDPSSGWSEVGAVIIEPVQGNGGMIPAPPGFLTELRSVCSEYGVLLVVDEVMSGFHRTGYRFAFEADTDVSPDVIVMGKSLSVGLPLAGCLVSNKVAAANPAMVESSTYAGNLVSCAAALAGLDVYEEDDMSRQAGLLGEALMEALGTALGDNPHVGEIRGRGLMVGIELVEDRATKEPLRVARDISNAALRRGLLVYPGGHYNNVIGLLPPLIVTTDQLTIAANLIAETLAELQA